MRSFAILLGASVLILAGCMRRTPSVGTVRFVLPKGFRGTIRVESHEGGLKPRSGEQNTVVYDVPPSGRLQVAGELPFTQWQRGAACYTDGSILPTENDLYYATPDAIPSYRGTTDPVALWFIGSDAQALWLYVGTQQEAEIARGEHLVPGERIRDP